MIGAAAAAGGYALRPSAAGITYVTARVDRGDVRQSVSASGTINPVKLVNVGTQVSGVIATLNADFNSRVKEGQVLAELVFQTASLGDALEGDGAALQTLAVPAGLPGASAGTIGDWLQAATAKTGENTQIRRFVRLVAGAGAKLSLYVHPGDKTVVLVETVGCDDTLARDITADHLKSGS